MLKKAALAAAALAASAGTALAQTTPAAQDISSLSSGVDFTEVSQAVIAVGALGIGLKLAMVAVRYVRRVVGGA